MSATAARSVLNRPLIYICLSLAGAVGAQPFFTEVTEQVGLDLLPLNGTQPRNIVFVDYDNDGFRDLFVTDAETPSRGPRQIGLYHNTGYGHFVDQTALIPAHLHRVLGGAGAVFGDYDNDGDEDLFLPRWPYDVLLRNDRGSFVSADLDSDSLLTDSAVWLDYDQDGYLDLYAGHALTDERGNRPNRLLRNNGDGTFSSGEGAGVDLQFDAILAEEGRLPGAFVGQLSADFNGDGWPDLFMGVLSGPNRLFLNDGQGLFVDATTAEIGDVGDTFSLTVGDIDNDGDLDLIIGVSISAAGVRSLLFLNDDSGTFSDASVSSGFGDSGGIVGGVVSLGDYDEDGFVDIAGDRPFRADSGPTALYRNNGNSNHWLRVELVGIQTNRSSIGTRVFATAGDLTQMREILGGVGRSQDEKVAHFGLGGHTLVNRLEIRWPSGQVDVLADIEVGQKIRVIEGRGDYHVVSPTTWVDPPPAMLISGSSGALTARFRPALFEAGAEITRVTANLSGVGGPGEIDIAASVDGSYALESTFQVSGLNRVENIAIAIEQTTSLGPYWSSLSRAIEIWPAEDQSIFTDASVDNWMLIDPLPLTNLTNHPSFDGGIPSWSLDGAKIAFESDRDGPCCEIYVMDADGANPVRLDTDGRHPTLSPDGTRIAFFSFRDGNPEIYAMDVDGTEPVRLTDNIETDCCPSWSPDGTRIAFTSARDDNLEIYVMDADGTNQVRLTDDPALDHVASWSSDGRRIAFSSLRDGNLEIYVMDADGTNQVRLTDDPEVDHVASWSPDGRRIAFYSRRDGNSEIYVMDADGTNLTRLTDNPAADQNPAWSPDGTRIAFTSDRDTNGEVYVIELDGGVEVNPEQQATVFQGETALEVKADDAWSVTYVPETQLNTIGYQTLRFAFHPGDAQISANSSLRLSVANAAVDLLTDAEAGSGINLELRDWQVVELPLEQFRRPTTIDKIVFSGNLTGTFYLDDISLVTASRPATAVEEEITSNLPEAFALDQNYPNPFNSGTVIRFALPGSGEIALAVFNLAGQKVTTLVHGYRDAGSHTLNWDGRDDDGRSLASGLYLYRLSTEGHVQTRKLVLLR